MRELSQSNLTIRSESAAMRVDLIAAGEAALDIDSTYGAVNLLKKRGAPIDWTTLGPVLVNLTGHGVSVRAPHPNAAKLFIDFYPFSRRAGTCLEYRPVDYSIRPLLRTGSH